MASNHWIFSSLIHNIDRYLTSVKNTAERDTAIYTRHEGRTRKDDFDSALSFKIHDPLWMLTRQWQFGRFKGNDCGTAVTTKIKVSKRRLDSLYPKNNTHNKQSYSTNTPMEYDVEKRNRLITPIIRIESAIQFKKMLQNALRAAQKDETFVNKESNRILRQLLQDLPLDRFIPITENKTLDILKLEQNDKLHQLFAIYGKRMFDGYKLYLTDVNKLRHILNRDLQKTLHEYKAWFQKKYLPLQEDEENCLNERHMIHEIGLGDEQNIYQAEDYHTGRLSWYSFDVTKTTGKSALKEEKMLSYLPVSVSFPGAPNKRLWHFEDRSVKFGQSKNDFSMLANAVIMQYTLMYSNDWMITPIEAETGTILDVEGIVVKDTFGEYIYINTTAEDNDNNQPDVEYSERWNLFGTSKANAYQTNDFATQKGLLFPPSLPRCEESKPIEEVHFLRDEMANMVWSDENVINDKCGGTIAGQNLSDRVLTIVDEDKSEDINVNDDCDYYYLLQNRVPLHWIPFIPKKIVGEIREIIFQRGRMPIFYNGCYNSVRPSTEILGSKHIDLKSDTQGTTPLFIDEEKVIGQGVKLSLTAQRTRWFYGESFNWISAKKTIAQSQVNSGLMFDELIKKESDQAITLKEKTTE